MKILLIDDHALFRDGILLLLEGLNVDIETFEAGSYESAKSIMDEHRAIDLVLLDLDLPGISYLDALIAIQQQLPDSSIVVMSGTEDHQTVEQVLNLGARGYIPKSSSAKIMLNALQLVISGGIYVPVQILHRKTAETFSKPVSSSENDKELEHKLTSRQCDVLHQLAEGKSNKAIGQTLNLTESTIRAHVAAILKAFNVNNRTHAVQYATQKGWVKLSVATKI